MGATFHLRCRRSTPTVYGGILRMSTIANGWMGKNVFEFLLQNRWEQRYNRNRSTLLELRHRLRIHLIDRGLDVHLQMLELYSWSHTTKSTYPNLLAKMIREGLQNFDTSSSTSLALILLLEAGNKAHRLGHRWDKFRLLIKALHKVGASCLMRSQQVQNEQRILRLRRDHILPEAPLHTIVARVRNIDPYHR